MTYLDEITHASRKFERDINKQILPLKKLGITYMAIQRVSKEGQWSIISSNPTWIEYSAGNQFYKNDPSLINPKHYESGISFLSAHKNDEFRGTLQKHAEDYFDLGNCLAIAEKNSEECWFTFLATSTENKSILNTYISKLKALKNFIRHFRNANKDIFDNAIPVDLTVINSTAYSSQNNIAEFSADSADEDELFNLSPREKEVLNYFLSGKTSKETARIIGISYRTIEEYFTNIKKKLHCAHKRDLLGIFK